MGTDLDRIRQFLTAHARVLDQRRFAVACGGGDPARDAVLRALDAYRNPDGGYGWGLEPDLRAPESQPAGAQHALIALIDAGPAGAQRAEALFDWLATASLPDGGMPFALPISDPTACAPFWSQADPTTSSLQITAAVTANAHLVVRDVPSLREHPWLTAATRYCFAEIEALTAPPFAYVLSFALRLLDATADTHPRARELLAGLRRFVPSTGSLVVDGGAAGESLHLLDLAPRPARPVRELFDADAVGEDLDRLERGQGADGGWSVDYRSYSPAATLEWRGVATVEAMSVLRENGR